MNDFNQILIENLMIYFLITKAKLSSMIHRKIRSL